MNRFIMLILLSLFFSCEEKKVNEIIKPNRIDLEEIIKKGKLTALVQYSSHGYFLYKGTPLGFEYELLKNYANEIGVDLEIKEVSSWDSLVYKLNHGEGDLIAANLQVSIPLKKEVLFTEHHNTSRLVLVQRKPLNWRLLKRHQLRAMLVKDPLELTGRVVSVRSGTHYMKRLEELMIELGDEIKIDSITEMVPLERLAEWVQEGRIDFTIMEEHQAKMFAEVYPDVDVSVPISFRHKVAWAVPKTSGLLKSSIDRWMRGMKNKDNPEYYILYNKYFKNHNAHIRRTNSEWYGLSNGKISPFDNLFKAKSDSLFTWTLLASMAYQESNFISSKSSWVGAMGLMQLMPETAEQFKVVNPYNAASNITGAVKYLKFLQMEYWSNIPKSEQVQFVLASYNTGPGHVLDAQRLAEKNGKDPLKWKQVQEYLLKLSYPEFYYDSVVRYGYCRGSEPVNYVNDVINRNKIYIGFLDRKVEPAKIIINVDSLESEEESIDLENDSLASLNISIDLNQNPTSDSLLNEKIEPDKSDSIN